MSSCSCKNQEFHSSRKIEKLIYWLMIHINLIVYTPCVTSHFPSNLIVLSGMVMKPIRLLSHW